MGREGGVVKNTANANRHCHATYTFPNQGTWNRSIHILIIQGNNTFYRWLAILISRESNDKDVAAMLDELTTEANEESFVILLQHGSNDITCK